MFKELGAEAEGSASFWTSIGPFTQVDALVRSELGVLTKAMATLGTLEGLLPIVGALVP